MKPDLLHSLLRLNPEVISLDTQPIINYSGKTVGWNCYFVDKNGAAIAGGTASDVSIAKQIAVAECFERSLFHNLFDSEDQMIKLMLDEAPSTSGFAAGFDRKSTAYRSLCEAIERWAWSMWIDEHFFLDKIILSETLSPLASHIASHFDSVLFYQKSIDCNFELEFPRSVVFSVFLGCKGNGIFAGSRVSTTQDDRWEHAAIESYRNLKNYEQSAKHFSEYENIIAQRARFFGDNYGVAKLQIDSAFIVNWPTPIVKLHEEVVTGIKDLFLYRSLCSNYKHWHLGDYKRFVY